MAGKFMRSNVTWNQTWRLTWTRERVTWQSTSAGICVGFSKNHVHKDVTTNIDVFLKTSKDDVVMSTFMSRTTVLGFSWSF